MSLIYTSDGTFTVPVGVTKVKVTIVAGGGGGGGASNGTGGTGRNSGISSGTQQVTEIICIGGTGGESNSGHGGVGGTATNGDINIAGGNGLPLTLGNFQGTSLFSLAFTTASKQYGGGGAGGNSGSDFGSVGSAGGGGGSAIKFLIDLTPDSTINVTVGSGGLGGISDDGNNGIAGGDGIAIFEW